MKNGVKNLKGARLFPKTFSTHGFGDASLPYQTLTRERLAVILLPNFRGFFP